LNEENQNKVESAFRKAIYSDRARVQLSNISRFGLLEVSRQRLRPSLNESYDIEHVLVRGPRSLGQSILRIVGEDAAKDNTGEIHVYVPADVASYLLNEKRYDIISIEKTNKIKILVIADPYKSRPYYKVIRIKSSDIQVTDSYKLTPNSPEPNVNWRDDNNKSKSMKPLVDGIKPPKMPKTRKAGLMKWLKSITGIEVEEPKSKKKPQRRYNKKRNNFKNKNQNTNKKTNNKYQNKNNTNKTKGDKKNIPSKSGPKVKDISKQNKEKIKDTSKLNKEKISVNKNIGAKASKPKSTPPPIKDNQVKKSAIKEIVKEKKPKKDIPLRAKNDPRQKS